MERWILHSLYTSLTQNTPRTFSVGGGPGLLTGSSSSAIRKICLWTQWPRHQLSMTMHSCGWTGSGDSVWQGTLHLHSWVRVSALLMALPCCHLRKASSFSWLQLYGVNSLEETPNSHLEWPPWPTNSASLSLAHCLVSYSYTPGTELPSCLVTVTLQQQMLTSKFWFGNQKLMSGALFLAHLCQEVGRGLLKAAWFQSWCLFNMKTRSSHFKRKICSWLENYLEKD
jgi:hypothetical protein